MKLQAPLSRGCDGAPLLKSSNILFAGTKLRGDWAPSRGAEPEEPSRTHSPGRPGQTPPRSLPAGPTSAFAFPFASACPELSAKASPAAGSLPLGSFRLRSPPPLSLPPRTPGRWKRSGPSRGCTAVSSRGARGVVCNRRRRFPPPARVGPLRWGSFSCCLWPARFPCSPCHNCVSFPGSSCSFLRPVRCWYRQNRS